VAWHVFICNLQGWQMLTCCNTCLLLLRLLLRLLLLLQEAHHL
jgi:hypothetical protein